ncbi:MAG: PAQR family membrane homeostasis protein TrhA [Calditrichia bacterium]
MSDRIYHFREELANSITHGIATALSIAALTALVMLASMYGDVWRVVSFSIYGATLTILYLASTLYHSLLNWEKRDVLKLLDHCGIYLLIAGTYTPFLLVNMRESWGWPLLIIIWSLALAGIVFKVFFIGRFRRMSTALYIAMGWLSLLVMSEMMQTIHPNGIAWLVIGGLTYTCGVLFYSWRSLRYHHAIWHLFVMAGSFFHFIAILRYVLPMEV